MLTRIYLLRGQTKPTTLVSVSPVSIPPLFTELLDVDVKNVCVIQHGVNNLVVTDGPYKIQETVVSMNAVLYVLLSSLADK